MDFYFILFYKAIINGFGSVTVLMTILLVNISEAIFFSIGGMGLISTILLTSAIMRPKLLLNSSVSTYLKN